VVHVDVRRWDAIGIEEFKGRGYSMGYPKDKE
jgi:hypothetical protein